MTGQNTKMLHETQHRDRVISAMRDFFGNYNVPCKNRHNGRKTNFGNKGKSIKKAPGGVEK